ncbi:hypothetical protein Ancab_018546 [Ancistrocladus abbreviatus]
MIFGWRVLTGCSPWESVLFLLHFPSCLWPSSSAYMLRRHPGEGTWLWSCGAAALTLKFLSVSGAAIYASANFCHVI